MHAEGTPQYDIAKLVWETSRADEQSISATGADIIADALVHRGYGLLVEALTQRTRAIIEYITHELSADLSPQGVAVYIDNEFAERFPEEVAWANAHPVDLGEREAKPWDGEHHPRHNHSVLPGEFVPWDACKACDEIKARMPWQVRPGRVMEIPPGPLDRIADSLELLLKNGVKVVTYNGGDA